MRCANADSNPPRNSNPRWQSSQAKHNTRSSSTAVFAPLGAYGPLFPPLICFPENYIKRSHSCKIDSRFRKLRL